MRRLPSVSIFAALAASVPLSVPLPAQSDTCHDFAGADAILNAMVQNVAPRGASLSIHRGGTDLYRQAYGGYGLDQVVAVASATKWLSATVILSLVDGGLIDLDAPASRYLPSYTGDHGRMTVRQMFSHTAGLPGQDPVIGDRTITLAQAADRIAQIPLRVPPGTDFYYGGVSMHVAGRIAEVVSGRSWARLFRERVATPLGMTSTDYYAFGFTQNPRIGGGARSTLDDYARLVEMLAARGVFRGVRVLSEAAIDTMFRDQTSGVPITYTPQPDDRRYGIGCWIDREDAATGATLQLSSQGAFGFSPWLDLERGVATVVLVQSLLGRVAPFVDQLEDWSYAALRFRGVACYGPSTPACAGPIRASTSAIPAAGDAAFALSSAAAPPGAIGGALVGLSPASIPILGVELLVAPGPTTLVAAVQADFAGDAILPAPLSNVSPGARFYAQFVWLDTPGCGGAGTLSTSHGLEITVE